LPKNDAILAEPGAAAADAATAGAVAAGVEATAAAASAEESHFDLAVGFFSTLEGVEAGAAFAVALGFLEALEPSPI
jgi:hypothetical protein